MYFLIHIYLARIVLYYVRTIILKDILTNTDFNHLNEIHKKLHIYSYTEKIFYVVFKNREKQVNHLMLFMDSCQLCRIRIH